MDSFFHHGDTEAQREQGIYPPLSAQILAFLASWQFLYLSKRIWEK
jgi:hypothetical protein